MKQLSLVLNIVLLIAVAVLFYLHFTYHKKTVSQVVAAIAKNDSAASRTVIAYVDLDSLNNNVSFIKQKKKELEAEQKLIADQYEGAYRELENERNEFVKRGNAITQKEGEEFQQRLIQKQQQVEAEKQERSQKLAQKGAQVMDNMQSQLKAFLNDYNRDKKYTYILATGTGLDYVFYKDSALNITADIVKGLNKKMDSIAKR